MDPKNIGGKPAFTQETIRTFETRVSGKGSNKPALTEQECAILNGVVRLLYREGSQLGALIVEGIVERLGPN